MAASVFDELVDLANSDLAQRVVLERWHDELPHVAFVEGARAGRELALQVQVVEPDFHQRGERTVRRERAVATGVARTLAEPRLEGPLGRLPGVAGRLHES